MYNPSPVGYLRHVEPTVHDITSLPSERATYWHVFGGPIQGKKGGKNNFALITAGPVPKPADDEVVNTTIPGTDGETFRYIATFTHEPSEAELDTVKPQEYR